MFLKTSSLVVILAILFFPRIDNCISISYANTPGFFDSGIHSPSDTTYRLISSINNTYGYEILKNGKAFIRQTNIPGLPGLAGFKRKEDAKKTARLVLKKLSAGIMPPSIDKHELDSMKIKF